MALPKITSPIYTTKLISTGKEIRFRPFTVKEEKLFLMASESEDLNSSVDTIKQVLNNCILDDIDVDSLPVFDIENLFLNLRARSVGEVVKLKYRCNNIVNDSVCGNTVGIDLNVLEIEPTHYPDHNKKIELTDNLGIVMKYPSLSLLKDFNFKDEVESIIKITTSCIDYIYDADNIYYSKDSSQSELTEFVESLQSSDLEKIKKFFDTMPKMVKQLNFKCSKCGHEDTITVEGIQNFFG